ncbi:MAG TPA: glycosyltransferase family 2 protein [Drouetiella sp.]
MPQATLLKYSSPVARLLTSVSLVIPAYNDESTIGRLLYDADVVLRETCRDFEIVVINDGSTDRTRHIIEQAANKNSRIKLVNHPVNKGFGSTIRELYLSASKDLVFSLPGDYQYAPKELFAMAKGLEKNDFVIGRRINRNDPPRRKFQSHIYNALLRFLYGHRHTDVNSIKLFRRSILNRVTLRSHTPFVDAELCIRASRAGYKVVEIPIKHLPRLSQGASGGKFSVIWETFSDLFKMRSTF